MKNCNQINFKCYWKRNNTTIVNNWNKHQWFRNQDKYKGDVRKYIKSKIEHLEYLRDTYPGKIIFTDSELEIAEHELRERLHEIE